MMSKGEIEAAVKAASEAKAAPKGPCGGCGRAYVVVSGERAEVNAIAAACRKLNLMFLRRAYGVSGPAIYIGYDNADGRALARSEAFAAELTRRGIKAYSDAVAD